MKKKQNCTFAAYFCSSCRLHSKCRTHLKNAVDKRKGFAEVEDNFHPAFRFFFLENFPEPLAWYNSRLTFTRYFIRLWCRTFGGSLFFL